MIACILPTCACIAYCKWTVFRASLACSSLQSLRWEVERGENREWRTKEAGWPHRDHSLHQGCSVGLSSVCMPTLFPTDTSFLRPIPTSMFLKKNDIMLTFHYFTYLARSSPIRLLKNCDKQTYRIRIFYSWTIKTTIKDYALIQWYWVGICANTDLFDLFINKLTIYCK